MAENKIAVRDSAARRVASGKRLGFAARHEWTLVGALAVLTFVLGCIGYGQTMMTGPDRDLYTWWDVIYASFQLFIIEGPDATAGWPLHLQIARALAPLILLYAAAVAVWHQVENQVALYGLLFRKRRFVIVCGIGETGFRIARDYCLNSEKRVVIIDIDSANALAAELENYGAILIVGNAMDPLVLMNARAVYAKELFLCTSDDKANIAIAKAVERLTHQLSEREVERLERTAGRHESPVAGETPHLGLRCFMCVDTPDIYEVFRAHSFFEANRSRFAVRIVNRRETIARNLFRSCAPDMYYRPASAEQPRMHALLIGFQALSRELLLQIALTAHYTDFRLPKVTVLCREQYRDQVERFEYRYPNLAKTAEVTFVYSDPMTIDFQTWNVMQSGSPFTVCYVAMQHDVEGILTARRLNQIRRLEGLPALHFIVCLNQQNFLADIIDDDFLPISPDKSALPEYEPIEYFETLDETICIDVVVNERLDITARTIHRAYLQTQLAADASPDENASVARWSDLPEHKKQANRNAADHIDVKLRISGCVAYSTEAATPESPFPPSDGMLEALAQLEHRRWMADKFLAGYNYGPQRDEDRMLHPDLIAWEELSEGDRQKDRDNVLEIPRLLAMRHQKICRAPD